MVRLYFFIRLMQTVTPWIARGFLFTLQLITTTIASIWVGIPEATKRIAEHVVDLAIASGMDTIFDNRLFLVIRWMAFFTILVGWIVTSHLTVWLTNLLFSMW